MRDAQAYEESRGERGAGENLSGLQWPDALGNFEVESANCPQPVQYATCSAYLDQEIARGRPDTVGHWIDLVNPSATWVGLGAVSDNRGGGPAGENAYDMETTTIQ